MSGRRRDDSGAVAVVVAAFSLLLFGFAAIVVDLGVARTTVSDAQTAADAAVVSGLGALYVGDATTASSAAVNDAVRAVKKSAYDNYLRYYYSTLVAADVSWSTSVNGTVPGAACPVLTPPSGWVQKTSGTNCILFRPSNDPREIRVVIPSARAPVSFGGAVGYDGLTISGTVAEAEVPPGTPRQVETDPSCVFCVLGGGDHNLQQASLRVTGGDIWMNGDLKLAGQGDIQNVGRTVHVEASVSKSVRDRVNAAVLDSPAGTIPVPPSVAMPAWGALTKKLDPCGSAGGSGRYGALTLSGTCTLSPGLYVFTDPVTLTGGTLVGTNVTIYFACGRNGGDPQDCGSDLNKPTFAKSSAARVSITAPTSSTARDGSVPGLALLFDDTLSEVVSFNGVVFGDSVVGTIYGRGVTIERDGKACAGSFDSVFVVSDVDFKDVETCLITNVTAAANIARPTVSVPTLEVPVLSR